MAIDYDGLVPQDIANEIITAARHASAAMALGRTVTLPKGTTSFPVVSAAPTAGFVAARGGRKPVSRVEWSAEKIVPEEIAVLVAIPDDFISDSAFPIWENIKPLVTDAIAYVFDMAILWGVAAPASFPAGGVNAYAGTVHTDVTALEAVNQAMGEVEASGLMPNGHAVGPTAGVTLRNLKDDNGNLVYLPAVTQGAPESLYNLPLYKTLAWDADEGDLITGDWTKLIIGIRQDIRFDLSSQAVLTDDEGLVVANAFQDDLTILRAYIRVGAAIGTPVNVKNEVVDPFAIASFTPTPGGAPAGASPKAPAKARRQAPAKTVEADSPEDGS